MQMSLSKNMVISFDFGTESCYEQQDEFRTKLLPKIMTYFGHLELNKPKVLYTNDKSILVFAYPETYVTFAPNLESRHKRFTDDVRGEFSKELDELVTTLSNNTHRLNVSIPLMPDINKDENVNFYFGKHNRVEDWNLKKHLLDLNVNRYYMSIQADRELQSVNLSSVGIKPYWYDTVHEVRPDIKDLRDNNRMDDGLYSNWDYDVAYIHALFSSGYHDVGELGYAIKSKPNYRNKMIDEMYIKNVISTVLLL